MSRAFFEVPFFCPLKNAIDAEGPPSFALSFLISISSAEVTAYLGYKVNTDFRSKVGTDLREKITAYLGDKYVLTFDGRSPGIFETRSLLTFRAGCAGIVNFFSIGQKSLL